MSAIPGQNVVMVIDFYDYDGNNLPQYEVNTVVTYNDYVSIANWLQNLNFATFFPYVNIRQVSFRLGNTTSATIGTASTVENQINQILGQINNLPANAGAGTTQGGTLNGINILTNGQNVMFDAAYGSGGSSKGVILSPTDYVQLQTNAQSNVSILNAQFTTLPSNMTYSQLEQLIVNSGVTSIPSSQSAGLTNTGSINNYSVIIKNSSGSQQTFILSQADYISLYSTQLNSIVSSSVTQAGINATLSQVLTFITQTAFNPQLPNSTVSQPVSTTPVSTTPISSTPVQSILSYELDMVGNDGTAQVFYLSSSDAQIVLNQYTNNIKSNEVSYSSNINATATDVYNFLHAHAVTTTNPIPPTFTPQNPSLPSIPNPPVVQAPGPAKQFNSLQQVKNDPIGFIVTIFGGTFLASILLPNGTKHLRSYRGKRR